MHEFHLRKKPIGYTVREKIADPIEKVYDLVPGDNGLPMVAQVDEVDVDAKIQAAAALSFDLAALAARIPGDDVYAKLDAMVAGGVITDPRNNKATVLDMTLAPKDKADAVDLERKARLAAVKNGAKFEVPADGSVGKVDYEGLFKKVVEDYLAKKKAGTPASTTETKGEEK